MTTKLIDNLSELPAGITYNGYRLSKDFTLERAAELFEFNHGRKPLKAWQFGNMLFVEVE